MNLADTLANKVYKKIIIYYFSGTGNSRNVAKWISSVSQEYQVECQPVNIAKIDRKAVQGGANIGGITENPQPPRESFRWVSKI
jgi:hypothetical protein